MKLDKGVWLWGVIVLGMCIGALSLHRQSHIIGPAEGAYNELCSTLDQPISTCMSILLTFSNDPNVMKIVRDYNDERRAKEEASQAKRTADANLQAQRITDAAAKIVRAAK